jgi:hypothetical protein
MLHAIDRKHDLIEVPLVIRPWPVATDPTSQMRPETIDPETDRFAAYNHAKFGKQNLDIRRAQREPMVRSGRVSMISRRGRKISRRNIVPGIFMRPPIAKPAGLNNLAMPS